MTKWTSHFPTIGEPTDRHRKCSTLVLTSIGLRRRDAPVAYAKNVRRKSWNATFNSFIARGEAQTHEGDSRTDGNLGQPRTTTTSRNPFCG